MIKTFTIFFLVIASVASQNLTQNEECKVRVIANSVAATRLETEIEHLAVRVSDHLVDDASTKEGNLSTLLRDVFTEQSRVVGILIDRAKERTLALNINSRLKIFKNKTAETDWFWASFERTSERWGRPFNDCKFFATKWFHVFVKRAENIKVALFVELDLDQCNTDISEIFNGSHKCDNTQVCASDRNTNGGRRGEYHCLCRDGYFYPGSNNTWQGISGKELELGTVEFASCQPCPKRCPESCGHNGTCVVHQDVYIKTVVLCIQLFSMGIVLILALVVFKLRKTKAVATGMWTILETILLGIFILYNTVVVRIFDPSIIQCLLEPWIREIGFIICYGTIILKLYRHLIEFRTRKAHRWVVKDTDLLKYLLIMILSGLAYMAAYTAITLNFMQENYSLLYVGWTSDKEQFQACKYLWWDYVTETGEFFILIFGIHLAYASRNARTQYHERSFLCAAISLELSISAIFYTARALVMHELHPDLVLIIYCIRSQLSQTLSLVLIFLPKFWYQQKQVRSLAQEYSCRFPLDAFKDPTTHRSLSGNNSDVEIGEISIADMSPDDIRTELKRLYLQLEMFKAKTICRDNPHISKRRGGRKAQHRRFSLQKKGSREKVRRSMSLHARQKDKDRRREMDTEVTEAEPSRTPEDSVCSTEGPSAIYSDLPSTNQI
ncbi:G-protein coupled receptor 158 smog isoform X1 [Rhynchophorus ferrugineus]|uniref:G-protein coupled receptor 158 smog isoform X1 n=1 Tax=Rhynchophorus ferrugineus TaxID=354439 RepID=UPI003FCE0F40